MAYHNILSKCDRALAAYLISVGAGTEEDVIPAKGSIDKPLPCTICFCRSANQDPPYSGIYVVKAQIDVKTFACVDVNDTSTTPKDESDTRVAQTFDAFHIAADQASGSYLADLINQAAANASISDFACINVMVKEVEAGSTEKGDAWIDTLNLEIYCAANSDA